MRLPDGRRLFLNCTGIGTPTVLLEGGFAATSQAWDKVQPALARSNRVCSYDRAGYGLSDAGPFPRDGRAVAMDLDAALHQAHIAGPYVLVGHSAGALYLRIFLDLRPRDVVAMVLADPSIEFQDKRFATMFGPSASSLAPLRARAERCLKAAENSSLPSPAPELSGCVAPDESIPLATRLRPSIWKTQISELDTLWEATSRQSAAGRASYGVMPLIVLTADGTYKSVPAPFPAAAAQLWWDLHAEIAARSRHGRMALVSDSSHMIMRDKPQAIVQAVQEAVAASK